MDKKANKINNKANFYTLIGISYLVVAIIFILVPTAPYIWYSVYPEATNQELEQLSLNIIEHGEDGSILDSATQINTLPPIDKDLPENPYVVIDKVGIYSPIEYKENYIETLKKGTWLVPDYGNPMKNNMPIILAAHRFGYSYWDNETRKKVSFFNLPKTHVGDKIKIYWEQREFTYEIYSEEENTYISDYNADLILYTCKYFNSPIRIFRYAKATY
jgi:sortase (surface protein transpeptidase)